MAWRILLERELKINLIKRKSQYDQTFVVYRQTVVWIDTYQTQGQFEMEFLTDKFSTKFHRPIFSLFLFLAVTYHSCWSRWLMIWSYKRTRMPPMLRSKNSSHKKYVKIISILIFIKMSKLFLSKKLISFVFSDCCKRPKTYIAPIITFVSLWIVPFRSDPPLLWWSPIRWLTFLTRWKQSWPIFSGYHLLTNFLLTSSTFFSAFHHSIKSSLFCLTLSLSSSLPQFQSLAPDSWCLTDLMYITNVQRRLMIHC